MPSAQYEMSIAKKGPYHIPWNNSLIAVKIKHFLW